MFEAQLGSELLELASRGDDRACGLRQPALGPVDREVPAGADSAVRDGEVQARLSGPEEAVHARRVEVEVADACLALERWKVRRDDVRELLHRRAHAGRACGVVGADRGVGHADVHVTRNVLSGLLPGRS